MKTIEHPEFTATGALMILLGVVFVVVSVVISGSRGEAVLDPRLLCIAGFLVAVGFVSNEKMAAGHSPLYCFFRRACLQVNHNSVDYWLEPFMTSVALRLSNRIDPCMVSNSFSPCSAGGSES